MAVGPGYYENGATPGAGYRDSYRRGRLRTAEGRIEYALSSGLIVPSHSCRGSGRG